MEDLRNFDLSYDSDEVVDPELRALSPSRSQRMQQQAAMPPASSFGPASVRAGSESSGRSQLAPLSHPMGGYSTSTSFGGTAPLPSAFGSASASHRGSTPVHHSLSAHFSISASGSASYRGFNMDLAAPMPLVSAFGSASYRGMVPDSPPRSFNPRARAVSPDIYQFGNTPRDQPFAVGLREREEEEHRTAALGRAGEGGVGREADRVGREGMLGGESVGGLPLARGHGEGGEDEEGDDKGEGTDEGVEGAEERDVAGGEQKRCEKSGCLRVLPISKFTKFRKDGTRVVQKYCKSCRDKHAADDGARRRAGVEKAKEAAAKGLKRCERVGCGRELELKHFVGRQAGANKWYARCDRCRGEGMLGGELLRGLSLDPGHGERVEGREVGGAGGEGMLSSESSGRLSLGRVQRDGGEVKEEDDEDEGWDERAEEATVAEEQKRCEKKTCLRLLPLSEFIRFLKDGTRIESKHCKSCRDKHAAEDGAKRRAAVENAKEVASTGRKRCDRKGCGRELSLEHFEGRQAGPNKWYTACAECRGLDVLERESLVVTLRLAPQLLGNYPGGTRRGDQVVPAFGGARECGDSEVDMGRRRSSGWGKRTRDIGDMAFGTRAPKRAKSITKKQSGGESWQPAIKAPGKPEESVYDSGTNDEEEKQAKRDRRKRR